MLTMTWEQRILVQRRTLHNPRFHNQTKSRERTQSVPGMSSSASECAELLGASSPGLQP